MAAAHHFQAESFTATKWSTAEQKAKFANQLMAFIAADFPENKFTKALYNRLEPLFWHDCPLQPRGLHRHILHRLTGEASLSQVPHPSGPATGVLSTRFLT